MKKTIIMGALGLISFFWAACGDGDDDKPQNQGSDIVKEPLNSNTAMALRAHDWRIISFKENGDEIFKQEFDSCEWDDLTRFNDDGTYSILGNIVKCDSLEPGIQVEGTWQTFLKGPDKYLLIDGDSYFRIVQVDQNTLKIKRNLDGIFSEIELVPN